MDLGFHKKKKKY